MTADPEQDTADPGIGHDEPSSAVAERLEAAVRGRVQGVGFRYWVVRLAMELRLTGWVANEPDGSVRCVAEGSPDGLDALERRLRTGPMGAVVDDVRIVRMPATGRFAGFEVRSSGHSGD